MLAFASAAVAAVLLVVVLLRGLRGRRATRTNKAAAGMRAGSAAAVCDPEPWPAPKEPEWDVTISTTTLSRDGVTIPLKELTVDDGAGGGDAWMVSVQKDAAAASEPLAVEVDDSVQVTGDITVLSDVTLTPEDTDRAATTQYLLRAGGFIPKGMIMLWADHTKSPGGSWSPCDGKDGRPNLAGRYLKGVGSSQEAGKMGGENLQPLNESHLPAHTHALGDAIHPTGAGDPVLTQPSTTCAVVAGVWTGAPPRGGTPSPTAMKIAGRAVSTCDDWDALTPNWRSDPNHVMIASVTTAGGSAASEVFLDHSHTILQDGQADAKADVRPRSVWVGYYISM